MEQTIKIYCVNDKSCYSIHPGTSLLEILQRINLKLKYNPIVAKVNNQTEGLSYCINSAKDIEFLDITSASGMRAYVRSLCFIMYRAVDETFSGVRLRLEHSISKGHYCKLELNRRVTEEDVSMIKSKMIDLIDADIPFISITEKTDQVIAHFKEIGAVDKVRLLESVGNLYSRYYKLGDYLDFYYGALVPSTRCIHLFDLMLLGDGILMRVPNHSHPFLLEDVVSQPKMLDIFKENTHWNKLMHLENIGDFNKISKSKECQTIINVAEALHEKKIAKIADRIFEERTKGRKIRFVFIAGPSSSGKTTFSKRLGIQLLTNGIRPLFISMDNYFVNRVDTPRDKKGAYDYESLYAINLSLFNQQLQQIVEGKEVILPTYSFSAGVSSFESKNSLKLLEDEVLIIEGIHALNPELTSLISDDLKYKIYVSALTTISLDDHNWIPTTDNRLIRRIVRDYKFRGYSAEETILRWDSVRKGEDKWIFPFQENADSMFNSALLFELAVLKKSITPLLLQVKECSSAYAEASRLLRFLNYIRPLQDSNIPRTSLLREFLGGSIFLY